MESSDALIARFLSLHPRAIDLTLERIEGLLARLGHPERRLPPVIHVAGTNGKGSTIAFMRAMLESAGFAVHVYTSPHLVRFHERIRLGQVGGGRFVDEVRLVEAFRRCEKANAGQPITMFEITTAAALLLFAETEADVLLLEVGLGGRGDATNVIAEPLVAVITSIGHDHAEYLGTSLAGVAQEKAGIIKRGRPLVIAPQDHLEADTALRERAERLGADPVRIGNQDFSVHQERDRLVYQDEDGLIDLPLPRLPGPHQFINAGTAIAALRAGGYALEPDHYEAGMLRAEWPARLQRLTRGRLLGLAPEGSELWLDGGHNRDGGRAVAATLADLEERSPAPLVLIAAMLGSKDTDGYLANFKGLAREVIAVPMPSQVAARPPEELAVMARRAGLNATVEPGVEAALTGLNRTIWERAPRILIGGSLYLAGEVLAANGTPPV